MQSLFFLLLLAGQPDQEAADLTLHRAEGSLGTYRFELADSDPRSGVKIEATYTADYKGDGKVAFEPKWFEMLLAGEPNDAQPFQPTVMKTDEHGMPLEPDVAGMQLIFVIHQLGGYLPNQKVEKDESFEINFQHGDSKLKGEGRFLGYEEIGGTKLARLKLTGRYTAVLAMPSLDLDLDSWFDPSLHRVTRVKGKLHSIVERKGETKRYPIEVSIEPTTGT